MKEKYIYAGTYTGKEGKGIYRFKFNEGELSEPELLTEIDNPKYLCAYKDKIVAVCDFKDGSGTALIDKEGQILDELTYEDKTSCYVACKDDLVYTANYHTGCVSKLEIINNKFKFKITYEVKDKAGCHQVLFYKDKVLVPTLFLDKIIIFDEDLKRTGEINFPEGSGPRHGVFSDDQKLLYVATELSNELFMIDMENKKIIDQRPLLKKIHVEGTAAIRKKNDHLYVSTRGVDVISVVDLKDMRVKQITGCGGKHPRDFIVVDDYLVCANRFSNNVVSFVINEDGSIGNKVSEINVPEAVSLITV